MTNVTEQFLENPESLIEFLENIVTESIGVIGLTADLDTLNTQLIEISKAIERLDKAQVSIPESLLSEKSKLLSAINEASEERQTAITLLERVHALLQRIESNLKKSLYKGVSRKSRISKDEATKRNKGLAIDFDSSTGLIENVVPDDSSDFRFVKVKRVFVIDSWFQTRNWRDVKYFVYNSLIARNPDLMLTGSLMYSKTESSFRSAIRLEKGYFTEGNLSASDIAKQCRESLILAGYNPISSYLKFAIVRRG
ncbi:MAG: hypothetical protein WCW63_03790 [Acholeplasmataceae bacterium]|jgi:hypothetical protein|nr:hypothetical protein [Candidatus Cloacimonadota bacterium]MCK9333067.1 hypothetical protein [Candidatus Cloacimonadota bacterium]